VARIVTGGLVGQLLTSERPQNDQSKPCADSVTDYQPTPNTDQTASQPTEPPTHTHTDR
jgi:hypothetical protein